MTTHPPSPHAWEIVRFELQGSLITTGVLLVLMVASDGNSILLPTTNLVVDGMSLVLGLVAPLLIVFLAGDLVWREREVAR